jgi:hypothetical protein
LLVISKGQLLELLRKFPVVRREMKLVAQKRRQHHLKQIGIISHNEVNQSGNLVLDTSIKANSKPEKTGEKL